MVLETFFKIIKKQSPKYLFELIPTVRQMYMKRHKKSLPLFNVKHEYFKNSFSPSAVIEWNKLGSNIKNSESLVLFKKGRIGFHKICHFPKGLKLITKLRLGLSHLRFHKFKHSFQDTLNHICNCGTVETTVHYLLHYPNFSNERLILFNKLQSTDENVLSKADSNISKVLLCGDHSFNDVKRTSILTTSIEHIISSTKRFDAPLYQN